MEQMMWIMQYLYSKCKVIMHFTREGKYFLEKKHFFQLILCVFSKFRDF